MDQVADGPNQMGARLQALQLLDFELLGNQDDIRHG
jgi:hypothetical protein